VRSADADFHFQGPPDRLELAWMFVREFIGWDRPFLTAAADFLLQRGDLLATTWVVTPTAHGGRRLREAMAARAGALLSPRTITPAWFLRTPDPDIAPDWVECLAWMEVFARACDGAEFAVLFPEPPEPGADGFAGLAREWLRLRKRLQENGLTLATAAESLDASTEVERWHAMAGLERAMLRQLVGWGYRGRSEVLAAGCALPEGVDSVVLAGVCDMPPVVERFLATTPVPVTVLIGAPAAEVDAFSDSGRPLEVWSGRPLLWPEPVRGAVTLAADPRQQAVEAFRLVCDHGNRSDDVALGAVDPGVAAEIARAFTRGGWPAFNPAADPVKRGAARCLGLWADWLADDRPAVLQDLLTLPEAACFAADRRNLAESLAKYRDEMIGLRASMMFAKIRHRRPSSPERDVECRSLSALLETVLAHREACLAVEAADGLRMSIEGFSAAETGDADGWTAALDWVASAEPLMRKVRPRDTVFWLRLCIESLAGIVASPADDRVIDVLGWLELGFEAGSHLVIGGMNEGRLPASTGADPWLGEAAAKALGLVTDADRAARDAYLLQSMIEARRGSGRVDLLCGKSGAGGESLLPSRLLLAARGDELARRVSWLFREIEPPDAGLRWEVDWTWSPLPIEAMRSLSATSLSDWLACPFRFYLKHGLRMTQPEPGRVEWNARDFGNIAHDLLQRWGENPEAREFTCADALEAWFANQLEQRVGEIFSGRVPMAVRIQTAALRQRLGWVARVQACLRLEGWETLEVEQAHVFEIGGSKVRARIDRIDRHRETGALRVIDYKTGKFDSVEGHHLVKCGSRAAAPAHLPEGSPVFHETVIKGKPAACRWVNLQLPMYAMAVKQRLGVLPEPCIFGVGATRTGVRLSAWEGFGERDLEAASTCTAWVIDQIAAGVFWPPAGARTYDDFACLAAGRPLEDLFDPLGLPSANAPLIS
jgi:ATP-dependent helicase/nuclease subunit B